MTPSKPAPRPVPRPAAAPAAPASVPAATPAATPATNGEKPKKDKEAAFRKLATKRTNKALRFIEGIGALSNRNSYKYTDEQVSKIFAAIEGKVAEAKAKFSTAGESKDSAGFTL